MTKTSDAPVCPEDHPVGTRFGRYKCKEDACGQVRERQALADPLAPPTKDAIREKFAAALAGKTPQDEAEAAGLPSALTEVHQEYAQRMKAAKVPANLEGDRAIEWSQKKLVDMLPEAVANLQWDLKYGTQKAREAATQTVLRANGVAQKDAATGMTPTIILHLGDSVKDVPFLQRVIDAKKDGKKDGES